MYAVIQTSGHQYKVSIGDEIEVDHIPQKDGERVTVAEVLLLVDEGNVLIGNPYLPKTNVTLKVIKHLQD